jgi:hypothetical protein
MKTKFSRRTILAGGISLVGSTLMSGSKTAEASTGNAETRDDSIKTRKASCNCGQLSATCVGPVPERISLCNCPLCQKQSGSVIAVQARFPREQVTIEGKSTTWKFPIAGEKPVSYRNCSSAGATFHFCPVCGSTVYYTSDIDAARIGIKIGTFADPTFPPPKITGFEEYGHPWVMNIDSLGMDVVDVDD